MKEFDVTGIINLSYNELSTISGGDPFLRDLAKAFGNFWGALGNTIAYGLEYWSETTSSSSGASNNWMMEVPPLTLFQ